MICDEATVTEEGRLATPPAAAKMKRYNIRKSFKTNLRQDKVLGTNNIKQVLLCNIF